MRFAYIDSNGNEVPIPSVDALALRIELGAINRETELYDAQADQWGPAHTHEIFHTLSRAAEGGEQDFVAPPPPMPRPAVEKPEPVAAEPEPPPPAVPEPDDVDEADLGLTLAEAPLEPEPADAALGASGLAPAAADAPPDVGALSLSDSPGDDEDDGADFDFGDLGGGLEMEPLADAADSEPAMDFSFAPDTGPGFGGLEQEMEFSPEGLGASDVGSGGLDLERPMSEFSAETPPAWMEPDAPGDAGGDVMDFSSVSSEVAGAEEAPGAIQRRAQRQPKTKPSAPKHRRQRSLVGPIVGVVLILGVGMGGYVAWPIISAMLADRGEPVDPSVVLPDLPAELLPQMREVAAVAFATTFAEARAATGGEIATPSRDWLGGRYLANAGDFQNVEAFWNGVGAALDNVRDIDGAAFHAAFAEGLASAGVAPANAALMAERADSGFAAAAGAREGVYAQVDELVDAALGLHAFLASNENNIEYTPASAGTSDPILEAKPSSPEIRQAMNDGFDRVNDALGALGYPGLVTADGLWTVVLTRIQEVGVL